MGKVTVIRKKIPAFTDRKLGSIGGVGSYYRSLEKYYSKDVELYDFYSNLHRQNKFVAFVLLIISYCRLFINFFKKKTALYVLNLSLGFIGLFRDGIILLFANLSGKKTIVFFHGWHSYMVNMIDGNIILNLLFKWIYKRAAAFIVLSKDFKEKLREWGFKQKIYIETTVVDDALLNGHPANENTIIDHQTFNILFLARVEKAKGIFEVIDAYEKLRLKFPQVKLTIAGDGSQLDELKNIVAERIIKDIEFTGYVTGEEKVRVLAQADVYLLPTYGEGMPLSVLEAMAFGLPVITRLVGGLRDFFEHSKMGFITESKDPEEFADYIERLIQNPELRHKMARYNAEFARKHFLASVVAKRLERIYQDVMDGKQSQSSWQDTIKINV